MTTFFVTSAVGQSMSGFLVDKVGARTSMYTGLVLLIASAVALGMAENVPMLYLSAMLAGAGNSVFHPSDYSLMNYNIQDRFLGHAFAWHNITGNIGWAICPFFMVTTAGWFGWRGAAFAASSVALIVLVIELLFRGVFSRDSVRDTTPPTPKEKEEGTFGFLRVPDVWYCFMFFFFTSGASAALTAYLLGAGAGALIGGFLTNQHKISSNRVVALCLTFAAVMAAILASRILSGYWAVVLMCLMGLGTGVAAPSRDIMIRGATVAKLGKKSFGRVYGFTYCGMDVGQSLTPIFFGPLLDVGMFTAVLFGVAILQTFAIFTALRVSTQSSPSAS